MSFKVKYRFKESDIRDPLTIKPPSQVVRRDRESLDDL